MQLLKVKQAADFLGVNIKTVHALIADGLPHLKISQRIIRIDRDTLVSWVESKRKAT
jgi:excisionase family DNA binding protein